MRASQSSTRALAGVIPQGAVGVRRLAGRCPIRPVFSTQQAGMSSAAPVKSAAAPAPRGPKSGIVWEWSERSAGAPGGAASSRIPAIGPGGPPRRWRPLAAGVQAGGVREAAPRPPRPARPRRAAGGWAGRDGIRPCAGSTAGGAAAAASLQNPKTAPTGRAGGAPSRRRLPASGPLPGTRGARHSPCRGRRACRRPL